MAQVCGFILLLGAINVAQLSPVENAKYVLKNVGKKATVAEALKLPGISDLLREASDTTTFQISDCLVELSKTECEFDLNPSEESCPNGLTLEAILDHFFPQSNLKEKSKDFLIPNKFKIDAIKIDKCQGTISFGCQSTDILEVIPGHFSIGESKLTIEFNFRSGNIAWNKLGIDISGIATIGGKKIEVSLVKKSGDMEISFSLSVDEISITDFMALFTRSKVGDKVEAEALADLMDNMDAAINGTSTEGALIRSSLSKLNKCRKSIAKKRSEDDVEDFSVSTETLTGLTIEKPTFSGKFVPKGPFEFTISGLPKADFFKGTVFAIVDKNMEGKVKVAVVASMENFSPATLLSKLTKKDLSNIPLLKDITLNFAASVANAKLSNIENEELASVLKAFGDNSDTIDKGIVLKIELPIKDVIEKMNPGIDLDVPDSLFLMAKIAGGKVKMSFPETWQTDLLKILSALTPKAIELLPDWLRGEGPGKIELKKLDFDYVEKIFSVQVTAEGPINIRDVLSLSDVNIEITHDYNQNNWDFKIESTQTLFDEVTLTVSIAKEEKNFKISGTIDEISTLQIARWLKAEFASESFLQKYRFLDFGVQDFKVEGEFGGGDLSLRISGTAIIGGWRGLSLEGILFRKEGKNLLAVGVLFNKVRLDEILETLFKTRVQFISWIGELNLALALSTADGGDTGFSLEGLENMKIEKGFQFRAEFQAPSDCVDEFCKQAKEIMGDNKVILAGQVTTGSFTFTAAVQGDWKIGSNVIITNISLVIEVSSDGKIYFAVNVKIVNPALEFEGSIGIGIKGNVELSAKMVGMWEKPFGLAYLSFGDVFLSVGLYVGVLLPYLEFGGRIVVGKIGNGKEIKAEGAIGIDPVTPTKNYFYANVNQLTIGKIAEAFELSTNMPSLIANTGFPDGLVVSFTTNPQGKTIDTLNVEIPFGFAFKGTIQIDTYKVKCDIKLNLPSYFEIKVDMDPLTLANGALKLFKRRGNTKQGPLIYGKVSTEEVKVHIAGFIHVLGIETEVEIKVNNQEFYFHIVGKIFNIIQASLDVKAKYESFSRMEFEVKACIGSEVAEDINKEFEKVKKEQTGTMKSVRTEAKKLLKEVMRLQRAARKAKFDRRSELQNCYFQFQNETGSSLAGKTFDQTDCTAKCRGACLGSSDWNSSCSHLEGGSLGCPSWNSCKFKVLNETCYAECKKTEILDRIRTGIKRGFWSWLWGKIKKGIQDFGNKVAEGAKWLGNKIKEGLEWTWNQIQKLLKLFINVKKACLSGSLSMIAQKACVGLDVSVEILQMTTFDVDFEICLDAGFVRKIAENIFGVAAKPIKECKSKVYDLRRYMAKMEVYRSALATAIKEQRAEEVYSDEDYLEDDVLPAEGRTALGGGPEDALMSRHGSQFQRYTLLESSYVEEKRDRPGHKLVEAYKPFAQTNLPAARRSRLNTQVSSTRAFETESPCNQIKLALRGYQAVAGNLQNLVDQYERERRHFKVARGDEMFRLKKMKKDLDRDCNRVGCSAAEYKDVISVMKSAKEGHRRWAKAVKSQLEIQNRDSIKIWRRTLDNLFINNNGYDAIQHLRNLDDLTRTATKKMSIAGRNIDKHAASSEYVSKVLKNIVLTKRDMSLTDVATRLAKINPHLAFLKSFSESC